MEDNIMPWGKYKGVAMANIEAGYFIWLFENDKASGPVLQYIEDNWDILKYQAKQDSPDYAK